MISPHNRWCGRQRRKKYCWTTIERLKNSVLKFLKGKEKQAYDFSLSISHPWLWGKRTPRLPLSLYLQSSPRAFLSCLPPKLVIIPLDMPIQLFNSVSKSTAFFKNKMIQLHSLNANSEIRHLKKKWKPSWSINKSQITFSPFKRCSIWSAENMLMTASEIRPLQGAHVAICN